MEEKEKLFVKWLKFKEQETDYKKFRIEVEEELESFYGTDFKGNSKTFNEKDLGYSINLKKNIKYNLDQDQWKIARDRIPLHLRPEKITYSLDMKGFEYLAENEEEIYKKVSDCVEIKPNKTTIKVEKIIKEEKQ